MPSGNDIKFTNDAYGNITRIESLTQALGYAYDNAGRLIAAANRETTSLQEFGYFDSGQQLAVVGNSDDSGLFYVDNSEQVTTGHLQGVSDRDTRIFRRTEVRILEEEVLVQVIRYSKDHCSFG